MQTSRNPRREKEELFSIHGGHSRPYCLHARDPLEDIIAAYLHRGFRRVGIVEHMPPLDDRYLYPEERAAGLSAAEMGERFRRYADDLRRLREKYSDRLRIYFGFETEFYPGAEEHIEKLREEFQPDYIVGSLHHVGEIPIDFSEDDFCRAVNKGGGIVELYRRYFDRQHELLERVRPEVVGHFDLIRKYDPDYKNHLEETSIRERIRRNLELVRDLDLILELNLRPWFRGEAEPYPSRLILEAAREMDIDVIPADDSHETESAGRDVPRALDLLREIGFASVPSFPTEPNACPKNI